MDILIAGSGALVHTLMQHDLIDEYQSETRKFKDISFRGRCAYLPA
jgi:aromatic ring-opening dioxygenase catalytic subunit (LigB family)